MRVRTLLLLLLVFLPVLAPAQEVSWHRSLEPARQESRETGQNLLVYVTAGAWCRPCQWMQETVLESPAVSRIIAEHYTPVMLYDYDPEHLELPVEAYPSLLIYSPAGELIEATTGPRTLPEAEALLVRYQEGSEVVGEPRRFTSDRGRFVYLGEGVWQRQTGGRTVRYLEYDRDQEFIYLESEEEPRFLALPPEGGEMWQWDPVTETWEAFAEAAPE